MGKKFKTRTVSVRSKRRYLYITVTEDGRKIFSGGCDINNKDKVEDLLELLHLKGYISDKTNWW